MFLKGTWEHCNGARLYMGTEVSQSVAFTSQHACTANGHPVASGPVQGPPLLLSDVPFPRVTVGVVCKAPLTQTTCGEGILPCPLCRAQGQEGCPRVAVTRLASIHYEKMIS